MSGAVSSASITTREATPDDAGAMSDVLRSIIVATGRQRPHDVTFVLSNYIAGATRIRCTNAIDGTSQLVGFQSLIRATEGNRYDVPLGWGIIGTHIDPHAHRRGIGSALFRESLAAARTAGLSKIDAYIGADNAAALRYYESRGFRTYREMPGIVQKVCSVS